MDNEMTEDKRQLLPSEVQKALAWHRQTTTSKGLWNCQRHLGCKSVGPQYSRQTYIADGVLGTAGLANEKEDRANAEFTVAAHETYPGLCAALAAEIQANATLRDALSEAQCAAENFDEERVFAEEKVARVVEVLNRLRDAKRRQSLLAWAKDIAEEAEKLLAELEGGDEPEQE